MFKLPISENKPSQCGTVEPTGKQLMDNMPALAKTMGMDQKCVTSAENQNSSGGMSASATIPFASVKAEAHYQQAWGKNMSSGCSNTIINAARNLTSINNINCNLNKTSSTTNIAQNANASINILVGVDAGTTDGLPSRKLDADTLQSQTEQIAAFTQSQTTLGLAAITNPKITQKQLNLVADLLSDIKTEITNVQSWGDVIINQSTLKNSITSSVKTLGTLNAQSQASLGSNLKDVMKRNIENTVTKKIGLVGTIPPNTKSMISTMVENKQNNINKIVNSAIKNTNVQTSNNGTITISAPLKIEMDNAIIDNNIAITMATSSMVKQGAALGATISTDILSNLVSKSSTDETTAGMVDLAKAQGDANAKALALGTGAKLGWFVYLIIGVIALFVLLGVLYAIKNSDKIAKSVNAVKKPY